MQQTSEGYSPYLDTRIVDVSIVFKLLDTEAADNAVPFASGAEPISSISQLTSENNRPSVKWATLERNLWILDGTWDILPEDTAGEGIGLWTVLSDGDGQFSVPPMLTMVLLEPASSIGFTLRFDELAEQWPASVLITAYSGESILSERAFSVAGPVLKAPLPVEGYDRVTFAFPTTAAPYRRVRLYSVLFGIIQEFDRTSIVSASWVAGASPETEEFPSRELTFTFDNADRKYNLINPEGLYRYLQDGQIIESGIRIGGELVDMGRHYFQKAAAKDSALTAEITANDRAYWLDRETYDSGSTGTWAFGDAVFSVLGEAAQADIPPEIQSRMVNRCIPTGTSKREAVRLLSQAARCACWIDRMGRYVFRELLPGASVDVLDQNNMPNMDGISVADRVDSVVLKVRNEFASGSSELVFTAGNGPNTVTVDNPCAYDGQTVADWLLAAMQRRLRYSCENRGNPAVEIGDTITIYNAYDEAGDAVVTGYEFSYDGGLTAKTEGRE